MSGVNGGRGQGQTVRSGAGRRAPQPTLQNDSAENNATNLFCGMFGGFLDLTQLFGNYFGTINEQPYMQAPFLGMGMDQSYAMYFMQSTHGNTPIHPNNPYIGGTSVTSIVYQLFGTINPHYDSN